MTAASAILALGNAGARACQKRGVRVGCGSQVCVTQSVPKAMDEWFLVSYAASAWQHGGSAASRGSHAGGGGCGRCQGDPHGQSGTPMNLLIKNHSPVARVHGDASAFLARDKPASEFDDERVEIDLPQSVFKTCLTGVPT